MWLVPQGLMQEAGPQCGGVEGEDPERWGPGDSSCIMGVYLGESVARE